MVTTTPVTIEQAAAILGVSASTIRRRIRAGTLRVEETRRPQGVVWLVHLPPGAAPVAEPATVATDPVTTTVTAPTPAADAMVALIQATLAPVLAPIVAELAATRQAGEAKDATIRNQAETIGRQGAELEAERRARQQFVTERDAAELSGRRDRRRLQIALAVAGALAVAATLAPAWVR
jgi:excisionase family DNA binding protein